MKKHLRILLSLSMIVFGISWVQAQERVYTGTVRSADDGSAVIGANVEIAGTNQGTSTGVDGSFRIRAREGNTLRISFLGMVSQQVTLGSTTTLNIVLESEASLIDDVVVVAYGTARKRDLTGSLSSVDTKLLESQSESTVSRMLEGAVSGLQVSSVDGQPGEDMAIRIRGIATASSNNSNPLFVVDGVAYSNADKNVLSTINPKDIESLVVLKDAASTALYGSRGSNGVIMITTKRGKQGRARVTFEGKWGMNMAGTAAYPNTLDDNLERKYEYAWRGIYNSIRYGSTALGETNINNPNFDHETAARLASQHLFNYNGTLDPANMGGNRNELGNYMLYTFNGVNDAGNLVSTGGTGSNRSATMMNNFLVGTDGKLNPTAKLLFNDDWRDEFYRTKFRQEYNVTVSGASEKTDYYFSAGYLSDPSYLIGTGFDRYNARVQVNSQILKWLKAGMNASYSHRKMQSMATRYGRNGGDVQENVVSWLFESNTLATAFVYDANGNVLRDEDGRKTVNDREGLVYSPLGPTGNMYSNQLD